MCTCRVLLLVLVKSGCAFCIAFTVVVLLKFNGNSICISHLLVVMNMYVYLIYPFCGSLKRQSTIWMGCCSELIFFIAVKNKQGN